MNKIPNSVLLKILVWYVPIFALMFLGFLVAGCGGGDPNPATQYSQRVTPVPTNGNQK